MEEKEEELPGREAKMNDGGVQMAPWMWLSLGPVAILVSKDRLSRLPLLVSAS